MSVTEWEAAECVGDGLGERDVVTVMGTPHSFWLCPHQ
ncbi:MAG: hypothetical protein RL251_1231 [Pseudomonadota bacterium]